MHGKKRLLEIREAIVKVGDQIDDLVSIDCPGIDDVAWRDELVRLLGKVDELKLVEECLLTICDEMTVEGGEGVAMSEATGFSSYHNPLVMPTNACGAG